MKNIILQSDNNGSWTYEIPEGKIKVSHQIVKGVNEIPESHLEVLEKDPFYKDMVDKKIYHVVKLGDLKTAEKKKEKELSKLTNEDEIKKQWKEEVDKLKSDHDREMKAKQVFFNEKEQRMVDSRAEALKKIAELEDSNKQISGELALAAKQFEKEKEKLVKEITGLKEDKTGLEKKVKELTDAAKK